MKSVKNAAKESEAGIIPPTVSQMRAMIEALRQTAREQAEAKRKGA